MLLGYQHRCKHITKYVYLLCPTSLWTLGSLFTFLFHIRVVSFKLFGNFVSGPTQVTYAAMPENFQQMTKTNFTNKLFGCLVLKYKKY